MAKKVNKPYKLLVTLPSEYRIKAQSVRLTNPDQAMAAEMKEAAMKIIDDEYNQIPAIKRKSANNLLSIDDII